MIVAVYPLKLLKRNILYERLSFLLCQVYMFFFYQESKEEPAVDMRVEFFYKEDMKYEKNLLCLNDIVQKSSHVF